MPESSGEDQDPSQSNRSFLTRSLPLQNETTWFILVNALDIFLTYVILRMQGVEANPLANWFYKIGNIQGMIAFKMTTVAVVCVIAQLIAAKNLPAARRLLIFGTVVIGGVVIYSLYLVSTRV